MSRARAAKRSAEAFKRRAFYVRKRIADLKGNLDTSQNKIRALKKAVEEQRKRGKMQRKRREMWKLVKRVHKPNGMCTSCFNRVVGRPVASGGHSYECDNCRLFLPKSRLSCPVSVQKRSDEEARKRKIMLEVAKQVRKPRAMCTCCFSRVVGRPVASEMHTYERGNCVLGPQ